MRDTSDLLFGGLENIAYNVNRRNTDLKFYEFGNCYYYNADNKKGETLSAYDEVTPRHVAYRATSKLNRGLRPIRNQAFTN